MGKVLHKMFKVVINEISQVLPIFGESVSEVSYFIPESRNLSEVTRLSEDIKETWIKSTLKSIKILMNNQTFLVQDQEKGETVTPCMDVYKETIWSDGSLDKLKLKIVVRGDLKNKELVGDTWSPTASMISLK